MTFDSSNSDLSFEAIEAFVLFVYVGYWMIWRSQSRIFKRESKTPRRLRRVVDIDNHIPNASYPFIRLTLSHFRSFVRARCGFASADAHGIRARASSTCNCERHAPIPAYLLMILGGTGCHFAFKFPTLFGWCLYGASTRCSLGRGAISEIYLLAAWP